MTATAVASAIDVTGAAIAADDTAAATATPIHELPALVVGDLVLTVAPLSNRTTIEIVVERDAALVLKAPPDVTVERATQFVTAKRRWVYRKLAEKDALTGPPIVKQFVEGEGFAYLGRSYRLSLTADTPGVRLNQGRSVQQARPDSARAADPPPVRLERGRFHLAAAEADRSAAAMRRWYIDVGGHWLRRRIRPWAARLGEDAVAVAVRDLGFRWGSARPSDGPQRINVHWATLQLPPSLIDYVLVHELAHLRETNHTPEFWATLGRLMPGYDLQKANLAAIGKNIWLGAVASSAAR
ncbi:MAG: SprT family zinc-dependent metalloprotease [bacterium]|nr:SprT family zinc-dependent metalloprotease [bacterium]